MGVGTETITSRKRGFSIISEKLGAWFSDVPMLAWLFAAFCSVLLEYFVGDMFARVLGMSKAPVLFGFVIALRTPALILNALAYVIVIYLLPIVLIAKLTTKPANRLAGLMIERSFAFSAIAHVILLYGVLYIWAEINDYRLLVLKLMLISIMLTLSLNVVNGYMGEFSCSHPGFMALGAYVASLFSISLFVDNPLLGQAIFPEALGPFIFPLILIVAGLVAAFGALFVAVPSFRTRGDYLAIISLAFMFIVKSLIENLEFIGGPRGLGGQPDWASLSTVFIWTILCIWTINNFVRSTIGKALNAVRDGELAASAMTVNTSKTKMIAFLFAAFWAGIAGGLFAHVLRYVNPGVFGIQKLAEVLAMVYFGGLNSVVGSIVGAVSFTMLGEMLRPLEIYKWIIIPVMLILVMIYRPTGLIAFKEFDIRKIIQPKSHPVEEEV
jgi:branched-chain amino acid transport system permease protein